MSDGSKETSIRRFGHAMLLHQTNTVYLKSSKHQNFIGSNIYQTSRNNQNHIATEIRCG